MEDLIKDSVTVYSQTMADAEKGDAESQWKLGLMYECGLGVFKDDKEACKWFEKAADQGHAYAQYNLGVMYEHGYDVLQDEKEAVKWYEKAAEQGNVKAQHALESMNEKN
jgi:TPR repeat protein